MITSETIVAALSELGNTPEDIRASLCSQGIVGDNSPGTCPIAAYLSNKFPNAYPAVTDIEIDVDIFQDDRYVTLHIQTPGPVEQFVDNFDNGKYPELELLDEEDDDE